MKYLARSSKENYLYKVCTSPVPEVFAGPAASALQFEQFPTKLDAHRALHGGKIDISDLPTLRGKAGHQLGIHPCDLLGYYYAAYNCRLGTTRTKAVRHLLNRVFSAARESTAAKLRLEGDAIIKGVMPASYGWIVNPYVPTYPSATEDDLLQLSEISRTEPITVAYDADDEIAATLIEELISIVKSDAIFRLLKIDNSQFSDAFSRKIEWHVLIGFNFVQDNLCRWNPGLTKLRTSIDWLCDFSSANSETRNFPGLACGEFDKVASRFLSCTVPVDLRPVGVLRTQLDFRWNNAQYWADGGDVPETADALLLSWKLQWILADESPIFPLLKPAYDFEVSKDVEGIFNADCDSGGGAYPGGIISYWTFQRVRRIADNDRPIVIGLSSPIKLINPLAIGSYQETLIWSRIFESLTGLNPILLSLNVGEDCVNLADRYMAEFVDIGAIKEVLTFTIPDGILWHDGRTFTVDDVAFSILSMFGKGGHEIARSHTSTEHLIPYLSNEVVVPGWIDLVKSLHHIEITGGHRIALHLREASRYAQEWFGDLPMLPMHVWSRLGQNFLEPAFEGRTGLENISCQEPDASGFSGWNGLIGTGPFRWSHQTSPSVLDAAAISLVKFEHYHRRISQ